MNFKKQLVDFAHLIESKGYINGMEGNISILDRETNLLYITPSGKQKILLTEEMVAVLDLNSKKQVGGNYPVSSEYRLHDAALQARPDVCAVIHSNCTYLTAYSMLGKSIKMDCSSTFALIAKNEIKCVPYGEPGTTHIADGLADAICDRNIALLGNHGVVSVGKDIENALRILEAAEETVRTYVIAKSLGEPLPVPNIEKLTTAIQWVTA